MTDRNALETAINDAGMAAAIHFVIEQALASSEHDGWKVLDRKPIGDLVMIALEPTEQRALLRSGAMLRDAVEKVQRLFYRKAVEVD